MRKHRPAEARAPAGFRYADADASALAYPCPDPAKTDMAGPASRFSRLASRCQRSDVRGQMSDRTTGRSHPLQARRGRRRRPEIGSPAFRPFVGPIKYREPGRSVLCPSGHARGQALCHLIFACLVGLGRLERPTSRLSGVRSNQLSYRPAQRSEIRDRKRSSATNAGRDLLTSDL